MHKMISLLIPVSLNMLEHVQTISHRANVCSVEHVLCLSRHRSEPLIVNLPFPIHPVDNKVRVAPDLNRQFITPRKSSLPVREKCSVLRERHLARDVHRAPSSSNKFSIVAVFSATAVRVPIQRVVWYEVAIRRGSSCTIDHGRRLSGRRWQ